MKYYSEVTKKVYDTEEALVEAEKALSTAKEQRSLRAKEVEDALLKAREAQKEATDLLNKFVKDYGSFKTTIRDANPFFWDWFDFLR